MAKKLIIGLMAIAMLLVGVNVFAATPQKLTNMEYTGELGGEGVGFTVPFGICRSAPWHSLWIWGEPGVQNANWYDVLAPIDITRIEGWFYNYPGYAFPGIDVTFHIWADTFGFPAAVLYSSAPQALPGDAGWQSRFGIDGTPLYNIASAGKYHFGYELTGPDTAFTLCTSDTGTFPDDPVPDPLLMSTTYDWVGPPLAWYDVGSFGFDPSMRWDIYAWGEYTECVDEMVIPSCDPAYPIAQDQTGRVPVYGQVCGLGGENLDGIAFEAYFDTTYLRCVGIDYDVTGPDSRGNNYTTLYDVIPLPAGKYPTVGYHLDHVGLGLVGSFTGSPDWPPDIYRFFDLIFEVADTTPVDLCYDISMTASGSANNYWTYMTTSAYPVLIDGGIFVPSHTMTPVVFSPLSPQTIDEGTVLTVDVTSGCSDAGHTNTLTVVDWGGCGFGTIAQDDFSNTSHGVLTFEPGYCDDVGCFDIVVRDECPSGYIDGTFHLEVVDVGDEIELVNMTGNVYPGNDIEICVVLKCAADAIGAYNVIVHFDNTMLDLLDVTDMVDPNFEYFYWDEYQVDDGNKVHIVGIANKPNQVYTPPIREFPTELFCLTFHVSAKWDPNYWIPIDFEVDDACVDLSLSNEDGTELYLAEKLFSYKYIADIHDPLTEFTGYATPKPPGYPENWEWCKNVNGNYLGPNNPRVRVFGFGTVVKAETIDGPYGDVNCDGIAYTIADAVFFMEYLKGADVTLCDYSGTASDINRDGHQWTIADLIMLVNILNGSAEPIPGKAFVSTANISVSGNTVAVDATIGGIYLTVKGGGEPVLNAAGMDMETSLVNGERRIIVMSWDSNTATGDLVTIPGSFEVTSVEVSDPAGYLMKVTTVPSAFALAQNYPNPFNPNTNIAFSLPTDANVSLTVYNIAGEKVAELVNGQVKAGHHTVTWNATDVASGVYFYKITAGNFTATRKMVFMK